MSMFTVSPAYGREYKTAAAAKSDWIANKDFIVQDFFSKWDGKPINREQASRAYPGASVQIRFCGMRKQTVFRPL